MTDIVKQATKYTAACYGVEAGDTDTMSNIRYVVWAKKNAVKNITKAPELHS